MVGDSETTATAVPVASSELFWVVAVTVGSLENYFAPLFIYDYDASVI